MSHALQFAAQGLEIQDLTLGEQEALALGASADQLPALLPILRQAAVYGYLLAQHDINTTTTTTEEHNG